MYLLGKDIQWLRKNYVFQPIFYSKYSLEDFWAHCMVPHKLGFSFANRKVWIIYLSGKDVQWLRENYVFQPEFSSKYSSQDFSAQFTDKVRSHTRIFLSLRKGFGRRLSIKYSLQAFWAYITYIFPHRPSFFSANWKVYNDWEKITYSNQYYLVIIPWKISQFITWSHTN